MRNQQAAPAAPLDVAAIASESTDKRYIYTIQKYLIEHGDSSVEYISGLLPDLGIPVKIYRDLVEANMNFENLNHQGISAP